MTDYRVAGEDLSRIDTPDKAAGTAQFAADVPAPAQGLVGLILRSPHAFAKVISVDARGAEKIPGVRAVLTRENSPDIRFGGIKDQSWFASDGFVRFAGEPVAAVAAEDIDAAHAALEAIRVKYEVL